MSGISLELSVTDKGSAVMRQATDHISASLRRAEGAATGLGGAFRLADRAFLGLRSGFDAFHGMISRIMPGLFSFHTLIGTLAGATGLGLLGKKLFELAEQAEGSDLFKSKIEGMSQAWSGLTAKLGEYIAKSPAVLEGLSLIAQKFTEWGNVIVENKLLIDRWAEAALSGVKQVVEWIDKGVTALSEMGKKWEQFGGVEGILSGNVPGFGYGTTTRPPRAPVSPNPGINGSSASGTTGWSSGEIGSIINQMNQGNTVKGTAGGGYTIVNNYNQSLSRSDIVNIVNEQERSMERDSSPGPYFRGRIDE